MAAITRACTSTALRITLAEPERAHHHRAHRQPELERTKAGSRERNRDRADGGPLAGARGQVETEVRVGGERHAHALPMRAHKRDARRRARVLRRIAAGSPSEASRLSSVQYS
jgi:hypothetical protein